MINNGVLDQIDRQGAETIKALKQEGINAETLQGLVNSGNLAVVDREMATQLQNSSRS